LDTISIVSSIESIVSEEGLVERDWTVAQTQRWIWDELPGWLIEKIDRDAAIFGDGSMDRTGAYVGHPQLKVKQLLSILNGCDTIIEKDTVQTYFTLLQMSYHRNGQSQIGFGIDGDVPVSFLYPLSLILH